MKCWRLSELCAKLLVVGKSNWKRDKMKTLTMSDKTWDALEDGERRPTDVAVRVRFPNGAVLFAYSPDGYGAFYYDTLAELETNHG